MVRHTTQNGPSERQHSTEPAPVGCVDDESHETMVRVVHLRASERDDLQITAGALYLLALLEQCDRTSWRQEVEEIWSESSTRLWFEPDGDVSEMPHVRVRLTCEFVVTTLADFSRLIQAWTRTLATSAGNADLRAAMQAAIQSMDHKFQEDTGLVVPVVLKIANTTRNKTFAKVLSEIKKFVDIQHNMRLEPLSKDGSGVHTAIRQLVIDEVDLPTVTTVSMKSFRQITQLIQRGVVVNRIPAPDIDEIETPSAVVVDGLRMMLAVTGQRKSSFRALTTLRITSTSRFMPMVFSAVQESQSPRELVIEFTKSSATEDKEVLGDQETAGLEDHELDDQARAWQWLAYSLFSDHTNHMVDKIEINFKYLRLVDVAAMGEVLITTTPLATLFGCCSPCYYGQTERPVVQVSACQFYLQHPTTPQETNQKTKSESHDGVNPDGEEERESDEEEDEEGDEEDEEDEEGDEDDAEEGETGSDEEEESDDDEEGVSDHTVVMLPEPTNVLVNGFADPEKQWLSVLLPGRGEAWVRQSEATTADSDPDSVSVPRFSNHAIQEIVVTGLTDASKKAVASFFQLVGHQMTRIEVIGSDIKVGEWCVEVLQACPQLDVLKVKNSPIGDMEILTGALSDVDCQLRQLTLDKVGIDCHRAGRSAFFKALLHPNHPLAIHLEVLELSGGAAFDINPQVIDALCAVLEHNRRLHTIRIELWAWPLRINEPTQVAMKESLQKYHGQSLSVFETIQKVAFLSVLSSPPMCNLDNNCAAIIFQFADEFRLRSVEFTIREH